MLKKTRHAELVEKIDRQKRHYENEPDRRIKILRPEQAWHCQQNLQGNKRREEFESSAVNHSRGAQESIKREKTIRNRSPHQFSITQTRHA